jgi:predicted RNA-binding protein (virulence factor B family)
MQELDLAELDATQEQLLAWVMNTEEQQQEEDMDEMVDYEEFGDEEYAELQEDVEQLLEANQDNVQLKVADKVMGTVYELDDDGAYVEIGQKASGFCPLSECSFAKLKSVSGAAGKLTLRVWCCRGQETALAHQGRLWP